MKTPKYYILDWANNVCFKGIDFNTAAEVEDFLIQMLDEKYETDRGEYYIDIKE